MKAWVLCNEFYHPGEVIKQGLFPLAGDEIDFTFTFDMSEFCADELKNYDIVVLCKSDSISDTIKSGWLNEKTEEKFVEFVEEGGGLLVLHAGTVICKSALILRELIGCAFNHHPEQCDVNFNKIGDHFIVKNSKAFTQRDEHYFIDMYCEDAEVILKGESKEGEQIAGFVRKRKNGRICVLTPGHNLSVFRNTEYQCILSNALNWCAAQEE